MTAADRALAEEQLGELRAMLGFAIKDDKPEAFLNMLRARIADVELELER